MRPIAPMNPLPPLSVVACLSRRRFVGLLAGSAAGLMAALAPLARAAAQSQPASSPGTPQRIMRSLSPLLLESPVDQQTDLITPNELHFVRQHFDIPTLDAATYQLSVEGKINAPVSLSLGDLQAMPSRTLTAFIECSGNSRSMFTPPATGAQWGNGAISVANWTGVSLGTVLQNVGLAPEVASVVAEGADSGKVYHAIPLEKALDPDTLVAYAQNGQPLTQQNGFPVRLVVPGWGGISSIKWLAHLTAVDASFQGFYNNRYYVYETPGLPKTPVQGLGVKSFIAAPALNAQVPTDTPLTIRGFAYSGLAQVSGVEISTDDAVTWQTAQLLDEPSRWAWVRWEYTWDQPTTGMAVLRSRATDEAGNVQPDTVAWNRYGYGYNAIQARPITIG